MKSKYVLDASALLALINEEKGHQSIYNYLPFSCMSTVNLSEVAAVLNKIDIPQKEIIALLNPLIPNIVAFDESQAYKTAELRSLTKKYGLSLGDRACISLGKLYNLTIITSDKAWSNLDLGLNIVLIR